MEAHAVSFRAVSHVTPLPPHDSHLSKTGTYIYPQGGCCFMAYLANITVIRYSLFLRLGGSGATVLSGTWSSCKLKSFSSEISNDIMKLNN